MLWRWYLYETLLKRLTQHVQDVAAELRPFIQIENAVVRQCHGARHRHVAATDQAHLGDGVMGVRHGRVVTTAVRAPGKLISRSLPFRPPSRAP